MGANASGPLPIGVRLQPLLGMQSSQERLYQICQLIDHVAICILDYASCGQAIELFDAMELAGRLDLAVEVIRKENGASK
jgi:hypothetical protein